VSRIVYRIVEENPPNEHDLKSYLELGVDIQRRDPDALRMASGLSVYKTLAYARRIAKRFPWKGNCFIAEIDLPDRDDIIVEQSGTSARHYTLWGDEEVIRSSIARIFPARELNKDV